MQQGRQSITQALVITMPIIVFFGLLLVVWFSIKVFQGEPSSRTPES